MIDKPVPPRRGFIFWSLSPLLVLYLVLMPLLVELRTSSAVIGIVSLELLVGLLLLVLFDPIRFWWAGRGVGAIIFLGYVVYFLALRLMTDSSVAQAARQSAALMVSGIPGLIVFGIPGLCYALFGRFSFREIEDVSSDDTQFSDDNDDVALDD